MRLLAVLNPSAHDFEAEQRWPRLQEILGGLADVALVETAPDDAVTLREVRRAVMRGVDRVVAIGGDGTIHLAVNALMRAGAERPPELAVIPFGTANDVAKSLGLPQDDLEEVARIAAGARTGALDVGRVALDGGDERFFLDAVSVGMDADVLEARRRHRRLGGYRAYAAAMAERALRQRSFDLHAEVDAEAIDARVLDAIVNNVPVYAGELRLPGSRLDDGRLDLYLFERGVYAGKVLGLAARTLDVLGTGIGEAIDAATTPPDSHHGRRVTLRLPTPARVQVDGELLGSATTIACDVAGQLRVAVP